MATELIDEAVKAIGAAVASACNLLDVETVVVGGGLGLRLGEPYRTRIEKQAMKNMFASGEPTGHQARRAG